MGSEFLVSLLHPKRNEIGKSGLYSVSKGKPSVARQEPSLKWPESSWKINPATGKKILCPQLGEIPEHPNI